MVREFDRRILERDLVRDPFLEEQEVGLVRRPEGVTWGGLYGMSILCGIGFTMSLFIGNLAFPGAPHLVDEVKVGVLMGSGVAALVKLYKGKQPGNHMGNFFECIKTREQPISDVYTHHRSMTTCCIPSICYRRACAGSIWGKTSGCSCVYGF